MTEPWALEGGRSRTAISTSEFFDFKRYQVDQDCNLTQPLNHIFNPDNHMFFVDHMGNLLSNLKLAFYEHPADVNFISRMFLDGQENAARETMVKSYGIVKEIYDDILTPIRQRQLRGPMYQQFFHTDKRKAQEIYQITQSNRSYEEIPQHFMNI